MPTLGLMQKPMVMPSYPHMMTQDVDVWTEFLKDPPFKIQGVWYDVHVGQGIKVLGQVTELVKKVALGVGQKRIDVVMLVDGDYYVVEVKPYAGSVALGQIINYRGLFAREYSPKALIIGTVVCAEVDPDLVDDFQDAGVVIITTK